MLSAERSGAFRVAAVGVQPLRCRARSRLRLFDRAERADGDRTGDMIRGERGSRPWNLPWPGARAAGPHAGGVARPRAGLPGAPARARRPARQRVVCAMTRFGQEALQTPPGPLRALRCGFARASGLSHRGGHWRCAPAADSLLARFTHQDGDGKTRRFDLCSPAWR